MKTNLLIAVLLIVFGACQSQKSDLAFEAIVAKDSLNPVTFYDLKYLQIKADNLPDSIRTAINQRIADECKLLINGDYMSPQDSIWKHFENKTVANMATMFLERVRKKEPDWTRFYDSLRVDTVFCSKQIICLQFSNTLNINLFGDTKIVSYLTFDLKTAKTLNVYSDLAVSKTEFEDIIRPYLKESPQLFNSHAADNGLSLEYAEIGIANDGLLVHYNASIVDIALPDVLIPWADLKGKGILKDSLIFNP